MKKIAILGPECTGKTELSISLATYYNSPFIPEFARKYVENLGRKYTCQDLEIIAQHQIEEFAQFEQSYSKKSPYLFLDTELIITKVWFLHVYKYCPSWLEKAIINSSIDFYLLCKPDIPWEEDSVRENGNLRDFFYDWYKKELILLNAHFAEIGGLGQIRTETAIRHINSLQD